LSDNHVSILVVDTTKIQANSVVQSWHKCISIVGPTLES